MLRKVNSSKPEKLLGPIFLNHSIPGVGRIAEAAVRQLLRSCRLTHPAASVLGTEMMEMDEERQRAEYISVTRLNRGIDKPPSNHV